MDFLIKCDVFNRLIQMTSFFEPTTDKETKELLSCLRLEYKNGHYYAVATNHKVAAIQYLGQTDQPDCAIHVVNDEKLIEQSKQETAYDSFFHIQAIPELATATLITTLGWQYDGNVCFFPDSTPMDSWRDWFPDQPVMQHKGVMYWDIDRVEALARSAPSGKLYFPQFIDVDKPVVIRDRHDENWCGLFIPKPDLTDRPIKQGAEKPAWV